MEATKNQILKQIRSLLPENIDGFTIIVMQKKAEPCSENLGSVPPAEVITKAAALEPSARDHFRSPAGRRFSRYNFERNLLNLACERIPKNSEGWMLQADLAREFVRILDIMRDTAMKHIRKCEDFLVCSHLRVLFHEMKKLKTEN
ncbi:MAG: hypothetical protein IKX39_03065 [Muribaculaceae bacterium]|nr:hypothetical protein [Muribaculaceae bacterium]